jgi:ribonuclease-3
MQSLNYKKIEKKLGIHFKKRKLLKRAFTHSSYSQTTKKKTLDLSNETLEFLGDAVLELVTREYLFKKFPKIREGKLSELKKRYTSTETLYRVGKKLGLGTFLLMDKGEELTGGRNRPSNIAGCLEAIIGALYLDRGLNYVGKFINQALLTRRIAQSKDYKSLLNHWAMQNQAKVNYKVVKEEGPSHHKIFYVKLYVNKKRVGQGSGKTKKQAEQKAAKEFLKENAKLKMQKAK